MRCLTTSYWSGSEVPQQFRLATVVCYEAQLDGETSLLKTPTHQLYNTEKSVGAELEASSLLKVPEDALKATAGEMASTICLQPPRYNTNLSGKTPSGAIVA